MESILAIRHYVRLCTCTYVKNCLDKKYKNSKNLSNLSLLNKHRTTGLIRPLSQVCGVTSSTD